VHEASSINDKIGRKVPEVLIFQHFRDSLFLLGVKDRSI
jgi:hypothetical protein